MANKAQVDQTGPSSSSSSSSKRKLEKDAVEEDDLHFQAAADRVESQKKQCARQSEKSILAPGKGATKATGSDPFYQQDEEEEVAAAEEEEEEQEEEEEVAEESFALRLGKGMNDMVVRVRMGSMELLNVGPEKQDELDHEDGWVLECCWWEASLSRHAAANMRMVAPAHPAPWLISSHWAPTLLMQCARAVQDKKLEAVRNFIGAIRVLASPRGTRDQRCASYLLEALQLRVSGVGPALLRRIWRATQQQRASLEHCLAVVRAWRCATPVASLGQVATNAAIASVVGMAAEVHVVDISLWSNFGDQWSGLLEALAGEMGGSRPAPRVRITAVLAREGSAELGAHMEEAGQRLRVVASRLGLPFEFTVLHESQPWRLTPQVLGVRPGVALAFNLHQSLHSLPCKLRPAATTTTTDYHADSYDSPSCPQPTPLDSRDLTLYALRACNPCIICLTEDDMDQLSPSFADRFCEAYRFFSVLLGSLEDADQPASLKKRMIAMDVEKVAKIILLRTVACDQDEQEESEAPAAAAAHHEERDSCISATNMSHTHCRAQPSQNNIHNSGDDHNHLNKRNNKQQFPDRREKAAMWSRRFYQAGFEPLSLSKQVLSNVHVLLQSYPSLWNVYLDPVNRSSIALAWRWHPMITFSTWHIPQREQ